MIARAIGRRLVGLTMQATFVAIVLVALLELAACSDLLTSATHGQPASRAVALLPSCFMFCLGMATATDTGRNTTSYPETPTAAPVPSSHYDPYHP